MIPLPELAEWLNAPDEDLALIELLEVRAVAFLEAQTGRYFGLPAQTVEYVSGACSRFLWLNEEPAVAPAPVVEQETSLGTWEVVDAADYTTRGVRLVNNVRLWTAGRENFRVTYTRGYDAGTEPQAIRQAVLDLCALKYGARGQEGVKSESIGDGAYEYTAADVAAVPGLDATLGRWRWPVLA